MAYTHIYMNSTAYLRRMVIAMDLVQVVQCINEYHRVKCHKEAMIKVSSLPTTSSDIACSFSFSA